MPLYDYRCAQCGKISEIRHGFDDVHREPCAACGGTLNRVFNPAPILFKGSGFYVTDSRPASGGGDKAPEKTSDKPASDKPAASATPPAASSGDSAA